MIVQALVAILLVFTNTVEAAQENGPNVFVDLGSEYCSNEIAIAAYESTEAPDSTAPDFLTYSAFEFESAIQAQRSLDDIHRLVAQTYSEDPDIDQQDNFERIVVEIPTEDFGEHSVGYTMSLPLNDTEAADTDLLFIDMVGIVKANQLVLVLLFSSTEPIPAAPGLSSESILPFAEAVEDEWDDRGDLADALPQEDEMPLDWVGQEITTGELPTCD